MKPFRALAIAAAMSVTAHGGAALAQIAPQGPPQATEAEVRRFAAALESTLVDPNSAEFRNLTFTRVAAAAVICGEINAKNRMGGYTGFQPFVAFGGMVNIYDGRPESRRAFDRYYNMTCNAGVRTPVGRP